MSWVLDHSPTTGTDRLVLLAIANHADVDGARSFPSRLRLAQHTGLHLRTLGRVLRRLEDYQHIDAVRSAGRCTVLSIVVDAGRVGQPRPVAP